MNKLRIVFMGTPDFATGILEALLQENYEVVGVVTAPDKPAGRGQKTFNFVCQTICFGKGIENPPTHKLERWIFFRRTAISECKRASCGCFPNAS